MAINFQNYKFTNQIDTSPLAENTKRTSEGISNLARLGKQIFTSVRDNSNKNKFLELVRNSDGELIEKKENRSPRDIDVVTSIEDYPTDIQEKLAYIQAEFPNLIQPLSKQLFMCDAYIVMIPELTPKDLIASTAYWYGLWSHTREMHWKGFVEINLDPAEDKVLADFLRGDSQ